MKHHVLVVEDNPLNRELLCDWLEMEGYEVAFAEDLKAAFAAVERHPPHAVLLDIQLGADDGLSLVSWMRQQPQLCRIPVIAVTAHAMVAAQERILVAGCNACVPKPIDFKLLSGHLRGCLAIAAGSRRHPRLAEETSTGPANSTRDPQGGKHVG